MPACYVFRRGDVRNRRPGGNDGDKNVQMPSNGLIRENPCRNAGPGKSVASVLLLSAALHGASLHAASDADTIGSLKGMSIEDLMNVEVTAVGRRPEKLLTAASAIQVITREEIIRSGAITLAEALRLADNLQTAQRGANGWAISARGFNTELANKLLVMIDGRTVYTPLFSGVFWENQGYLLEDIERIEVVSGPGGTLWGANAVNGVISVITRDAAQTTGLYLEGGGGPEVNVAGGLRYGARLAPDVYWRVFGKYLDLDDSVLADGSPAMDGLSRGQAGFRLDAGSTSGSRDAFTLQGDFYETERHDRLADADTRGQGANILGRWTRRVSGTADFSLQAYYDWTRFSDKVPEMLVGTTVIAPAGRFRDDLHTIDLDFQHHFRAASAHDITWGLGFRHTSDKASNAPALAFLPGNRDQQLYSLFVQDQIRLRDQLSLTVGSKFEHTGYTGFEYEPSARLEWRLADRQLVWGAVSRAIRAPARIDRDLRQPAPPNLPILYGDSGFRSEKVVAFELGHRAQHGDRVSSSVVAFYNEYDDLRTTGVTPEVLLPFRFENALYGHTYGVEITGRVQITPRWSVRAGYNLLEERLRVREGSTDITNGLNETADPEQQVSLRTSLNLPRGLEFDAGLRWVDILHNNNGPEPGTVPHYLELDVRLGWQISRHLNFAVVGRNLLHDQHPEYGFPGPGRTEVERSLYGKLAWRY